MIELRNLQWESEHETTHISISTFMLHLFTPSHYSIQGLLVASRLDADVNTSNCRIAFFGKMVARVQVNHEIE